ncbi:MAG: NUDIX hydrolase [Vicinamibacterales bacterium]
MVNETNPVRVESSETIYRGRIFSLAVDRVTLRSGHTVGMEIVRHPGSVVMLPMAGPRQVVLVRQFRHTITRWIWELPAGSLKPGEDPALAAARECEEEIGFVPRRVSRLRSFYPTPGFCDEEMTFFRCEDLQAPPPGSTVRKDEDEDLEPRTFVVDEVRAMIVTGEIVDMKTVVGMTLID